MALEALLGEPLFDLLAAIRAVGPYPAGSITGIEHVLQLLAVMHRGAADDVTPHQLVAPLNADMVLVAKVRLSILFAVRLRGAAVYVTPNQLVGSCNAEMVLVAKVRLSMRLWPARILVFLSVLCRFLLPRKRGLARLYCRIILARVTLARRGNNGRVNDLSAHRQITLGLEIAVKLIEQPFDRARLGQGFAIEP